MALSMLAAVLRKLVRYWLRLSVVTDAVPAGAGVLLANHRSCLDALLVGVCTPPGLLWVRFEQDVLPGWLHRLLAVLGVRVVVVGSRHWQWMVLRHLRAGKPLLVFPEGEPTGMDSPGLMYPEVLLLAGQRQLPVWPVSLFRSPDVVGWLPWRKPPVAIHIGCPEQPCLPEEASCCPQQARAWLETRINSFAAASRLDRSLWAACVATKRRDPRSGFVLNDIRQKPLGWTGFFRMAAGMGRIVAGQVSQGDVVGILLPNVSPVLAAVVGVSAQRRVCAMINHTAGSLAMRQALAAARIRLVITSRLFLQRTGLTDEVAQWPDCRLLYLEDLAGHLGWQDRVFALLAGWWPAAFFRGDCREEPAVLMFTSGSEGVPKGVLLTQRSMLVNVAQIRSVIDIRPTDRMLTVLPMFHSFGLTAGGLLPLLTGMPVMLYPSPLHYHAIPQQVWQHRATVLIGTATFLGQYARLAEPAQFQTLRIVVAGAERLSDAIRQLWLDRFGIRILEGYGMTEAAPVVSVNSVLYCQSGGVGRLLPGIRGRTEPVDGVQDGGMLWIAGANLMRGYLVPGQPLTAIPQQDEWYCTGDLVRLDENSQLTILGRLRRFAKVAGEMVSLDLSEQIASLAAPNADHAAVFSQSDRRGETIILYTTSHDLDREKLVRAARMAGIVDLAVPRRIVPVDAIPLLGNGKINYVLLEQQGKDLEASS